jgi:hypothetical protein
MRVIMHNYLQKILFLIQISFFVLLTSNAIANDQPLGMKLKGNNIFNGLVQAKNDKWPVQIELSFNKNSRNQLTGKMTWKTLGSVVKVKGVVYQDQLIFKSVAHIKKGQSIIGTTFILTRKENNVFKGVWEHKLFNNVHNKVITLNYLHEQNNYSIASKKKEKIEKSNTSKTSSKENKNTAIKKLSKREQTKKDRELFSQATMASRKGDYLTAKKLLNEIINNSQKNRNIKSAKNQLKIADNMINITAHHASTKQLNKSKAKTSKEKEVNKPDSDLALLMANNKLSVNQKSNHNTAVKTTTQSKGTKPTKSESEIVQLLSDLIVKSRNMVKAVKNNKNDYKQTKELLTKEVVPGLNEANLFLLSKLNHRPADIETYNDVLINTMPITSKLVETFNYCSQLTGYWSKWIYENASDTSNPSKNNRRELITIIAEPRTKYREVSKSMKKYKEYSADVLDFNLFKQRAKKYAWNPLSMSKLLPEFFPVLNKLSDEDFYDDKLSQQMGYLSLSFEIGNYIHAIRRKSKDYFNALPENSEPKIYAKEVEQVINKQDDFYSAIEQLRKQKSYYLDWNYEQWPDSLILALKRANERRRLKFKGLAVLPNVEKPSSSNIKYMGNLVIGKTKILDAVNGYMTAVEELYSRTNYITTGPYKEKTPLFLGVFEDKLKMNVQSYNDFDKHVEVACIIYDRKGYGNTEDCLFFKDKVLAGHSLNMSSEHCKSECTRHNTIIDYFSGMGFKLVDESIEGKRIWRKLVLGDKKFNYKLWGGERSYIKKGYINGVFAQQRAQVCVFDSSIEKVLSEHESKGMWTCR